MPNVQITHDTVDQYLFNIYVAILIGRAITRRLGYPYVTKRLWSYQMNLTEQTRATGIDGLRIAGWQAKLANVGPRYTVTLSKNGKNIRALVKVASKGSAMVKTTDDDADSARISGFGPDVSHVAFFVRMPANDDEVHVYVVPISVAEAAFREAHRAWRDRIGPGPQNTTWVIWFQSQTGDADCNGFADKWASFKVGSGKVSETPRPLTVEQAKAGIALHYGVEQSQVRISIDL